jgi:hypothetical protein
LRPPGLSDDDETSFMRASRSIRPALRNAFAATVRVPGAGVGLENMNMEQANDRGVRTADYLIQVEIVVVGGRVANRR